MDNTCKHLRYPVGIQSFSEIREGGYVYVDKTAFVHRLMREGKYYFLSRPRRFGKSLLLSTIEAYYSGRRDLFKGLALDSLTDDWEPHPILHLDLNTGDYSSPESLLNILDHTLGRWEQEHGIPQRTKEASQRFGDLLAGIHQTTGKKVVVLIDEYDKPMLHAIGNEPLIDSYRNTLKAFYGNLKSMDSHIEFAMLTGVARFSKVSIFSDLNNLRDISFSPNFSAICGISNDELDHYFQDGMECLAERYKKTREEIRLELKRRYDGYHFSEDLTDIYNPFSLVNVFADTSLRNYWFLSGTPSYIVKLLKSRHWRLSDMEGYRVSATRLGSESILNGDPLPALYQSGYLTIKAYDLDTDTYTLGYPNGEVERSFIDFLFPLYIGRESTDSEFDIDLFVDDVNNGDPQAFMTRLDSLLRGVPHIGDTEPHEVFFRNALYLVFKMVGFFTHAESHTSSGRIDLTVETPDYVYVFEFKVNKTAAEAMEQIHRKEYWKKFAASGKTIYLVAANFNSEKRALDDIEIAEA